MQNYVRSGLLINDISDHLPVFSIYNCKIQRNEEKIYGRIARVRTKEAINELRNGLLKELWRGVYIEDVNAASESFLNRFLSLYDKHCPVISYNKQHTSNMKPWIIKGLQNACKKKNKLYRNFIKFRSKDSER